MIKRLTMALAVLALMSGLGCKGDKGDKGEPGAAGAAGAAGTQGTKGDPGTDAVATPSISGITPDSVYIGRTVDLTISGYGTSWTADATVTFSDAKITVNHVTAGSPTGLVVNVTIAPDDTPNTSDVTVTEGSDVTTYTGVFQVRSSLEVSIPSGASGVQQGGFATIHLRMLDTSTPFDANTAAVTVTPPTGTGGDVTAGQPSVTDFGADVQVLADVFAPTGSASVDIQSGSGADLVDSQHANAFSVVPRTPQAITSGTAATGQIQTTDDTALLSIAPTDNSLAFLQVRPTSADGEIATYVLPKSGKYADIVASVASTWGQGVSSTDAYYFVVADGSDLFGQGPVPAHYSVDVELTPVTAATEPTETSASNDDDATSAVALANLPALASGTLGYGSNDPTTYVDWYAVTVTGSSVASPKNIHVATGGDAATDSVLEIFDSTGANSLGSSTDADYQEDLTVPVTTDGTYLVQVSASQQGYFDPSHNTYQLFVEVK